MFICVHLWLIIFPEVNLNVVQSTHRRQPRQRRSTGPVTPEGKARISRNAVKHGLLAQAIVLPNECGRGFETGLAKLQEELQPRTYIEHELIEIMAAANWRRQRVWHLEMAQLTHAIHAQEALPDPVADQENSEIPSMHTALAFGRLSDHSSVLKTPNRYEVRVSREFTRHLLLYESRRGARPGELEISKQTEAKIRETRTVPPAVEAAGSFTLTPRNSKEIALPV